MAATRVYILAKELGVKSSAIVEKCQAEDLDVKNHMSSISMGLAATIREWFSEGEHTTTVETAQKVDLSKVRIKKKAKRKTSSKKAAAETETKEELATDTVEAATAEVEAEAPEETVAEPEPIVPAGPMLEKPKPATLKGPQVVRIEAPEPERRPKPRGPKRHDAPVTEPLMQTDDKTGTDADSSKKSSKHKDRTHGRRSDGKDEDVTRRAKFENLRKQRDFEERRARLTAASGTGMRIRPSRKLATKSSQYGSRMSSLSTPSTATVTEPVLVKDLSSALAVKSSDIIFKLMAQGVMATANQVVSPDVAELIALEYNCELTVELKSTQEELIGEEFKKRDRKNLEPRPVVATMLGHVDHGKTSLLDKIRSAEVAAGEAGGITQHISAYQVTHGKRKITFIDTPGHAAFTAMRARGTMTDVVILVIAADDGIMPQTVEVINHAKAADVQIIVTLNKIDLPGCDINRIYSQLSEHELVPIEWGGKTEIVKTSATTGEGIDDLLEHLEYTAEVLELKADDTIPATGWVVEAELSSQIGVVATILIQEGQLNKGDVLLAGSSYGRVKTLQNSYGKHIKSATTSMPIRITGLSEVPRAGDRFYCLGTDINKAKSAAEETKARSRETTLAKRTQVTLENLFTQIEAGNVKELNVIIRADVQGSIDVLTKYLSELSTDEVKIKILHSATGGITEGDAVLAEASNAIIIGFNVVSEEHVAKIAESKGVDIRLYTIIYRITEDLEKSMTGLLEPEEKEVPIGRAIVRNTFKVSKVGTIAGCYVNDGVVKNKAKARLIRDNIVIRDELELDSLKHFKDDAKEVKAGLECGIKLSKYDDIKVDDVFEFFETIEVARSLR